MRFPRQRRCEGCGFEDGAGPLEAQWVNKRDDGKFWHETCYAKVGLKMDRETFYAGLLLALPREGEFSVPAIQAALSEALKVGRHTPNGPAQIDGVPWDSDRTNELIAFGMSSRLLRILGVELEVIVAPSRDPRTETMKEALGYEKWFETVGEKFAETLRSGNSAQRSD